MLCFVEAPPESYEVFSNVHILWIKELRLTEMIQESFMVTHPFSHGIVIQI